MIGTLNLDVRDIYLEKSDEEPDFGWKSSAYATPKGIYYIPADKTELEPLLRSNFTETVSLMLNGTLHEVYGNAMSASLNSAIPGRRERFFVAPFSDKLIVIGETFAIKLRALSVTKTVLVRKAIP